MVRAAVSIHIRRCRRRQNPSKDLAVAIRSMEVARAGDEVAQHPQQVQDQGRSSLQARMVAWEKRVSGRTSQNPERLQMLRTRLCMSSYVSARHDALLKCGAVCTRASFARRGGVSLLMASSEIRR